MTELLNQFIYALAAEVYDRMGPTGVDRLGGHAWWKWYQANREHNSVEPWFYAMRIMTKIDTGNFS